MTQISEIIVSWIPEDSGRASSVQIQSRIVGTSQWQEVATGIDPTLGTLAFQSNAPGSEIEVRGRLRMSSGVFGPWTGMNIVAAGTKVDYSTGVINKPTKLQDINASEGGKLTGIEPGATVGAPVGTNVAGVPAGTLVQDVVTNKTNFTQARLDIDADRARVDAFVNNTFPASVAAIKAEKDADIRTVTERIESIEDGTGNAYDDTALKAVVEANKTAATSLIGAVADRSSILEASAVAASGSEINANSRFAFWANGNGLPGKWDWWQGPQGTVTRFALPTGGYAFRHNTPVGAQSGIMQTLVVQPGWYVLTADVELLDGSLLGAGLTLSGSYTLDFARDPDTNGQTSQGGFKRRQFTKLIKVGELNTNFHIMSNWAGTGDAYKFIDWHHASIRPATQSEIDQQKVFTIDLPALGARITNAETTILDLPNRYSAANRTSTLEAQMARTSPSQLSNDLNFVNGRIDTRETAINARIEDRATAIADAKTGAVAQTVATLRSEYNGTASTVSTQAASIADVTNRTRAYWQTTAVAGNNRAQLSIFADGNGGAGVDIVGNVSISGDLLLGGTIPLSAVQRNQFARYGEAVWYNPGGGMYTPPYAQKTTLINVPFGLVGDQGSIYWEVLAYIETNAGKSDFYYQNGRPYTINYRDDGGVGINLMNGATNVISTVNPVGSVPVIRNIPNMSGPFYGTLLADIQNGTYDSGQYDDGEQVVQTISATYRVSYISVKCWWKFV